MTVDEDHVVCGSCGENFPFDHMKLFLNHKRFDCDDKPGPGATRKQLWCGSCLERFDTPWSLLQHAQNVHALRIYLQNNRVPLPENSETNIRSIEAQQAKISALEANLAVLQEEVNSVALKQAASLHQSAATEPAALTIGPSLRGKRSSLTSPSGLRQNSAGGVERFSGNSARTGVEEDSQFPGSDEQQIKTLAEKFDVSAEIVRTILDVGTESRKTKIFADESIAKAPAVVTAAMQQTSSGQASSDNAHSVLRQPGLSAAKAITAVGQKRPSASVSLAKSVASVAPVSALPGPRVLAVAIPSSGGRSVLSSGAPKGRIAVRPAASHSNTIAALVSPTRSGTGPMLSQPTITVVNRGSSATNAKPVISILQPIATGLDKSATVQRVGLVSSSRGSNTDESSKHAVASNQMSQLVTTHTSTGVHETVVSTRSEALPVSPSGKTAPTATSECKEISTCEANEKVQVPPPKPELDSGGVNARNSGGAGDGVTREADGADTDDPGQCCDDQDCGVTVMPGTHEKLQECCSAVLPKKRKRHMETKHWGFFKSARRRYAPKPPVKKTPSSVVGGATSETSTIYIDLEHVNARQPEQEQHHPSGILFDNRESKATAESTGIAVGFSSEVTTAASIGSSQSPFLKSKGASTQAQRSLIIPAGATLSIPLSCSSQSVAGDAPRPANPTVFPLVVPSDAMATVKREAQGDDEAAYDARSLKQEMKYSDLADIRQKQRRYPTSRPFKCDECEHSFNQRIHLRKHKSKHTGIKPFKCEQCDYSTVERSHLKVHIRVHTGEKPYKCTYCEYATAQNSTLKIHLKRHHSSSGRQRAAPRPPLVSPRATTRPTVSQIRTPPGPAASTSRPSTRLAALVLSEASGHATSPPGVAPRAVPSSTQSTPTTSAL